MPFDGPRGGLYRLSDITFGEGDVSMKRERKVNQRVQVYQTAEERTAYSAPIFYLTWKSPQSVPMSVSRMSSTRFMMVAPAASAMGLLLDFRSLRIAATSM